MFSDKRYIIPLFLSILLWLEFSSTWSSWLLVAGVALGIYKSYGVSLRALLAKRWVILLIASGYQVLAHLSSTLSLSYLLLGIIRILGSMLIAFMMNDILSDEDVVASLELYLRPLKRPKASANLAVSMILVRYYLRLLPKNWQARLAAVRLRTGKKRSLAHWLLALQWFLFDALRYPHQTNVVLHLRGYQERWSIKIYPKKDRESLYFLGIHGILVIAFAIIGGDI
jgi:hypothetical protein